MSERDDSTSGAHGDEVAVVGMAGRFPRAADLATFWRNLRDGVEGITPLSDADLRPAGAGTGDPAYVRVQALLDGFDLFDAPFFGFQPREAEITNPQHRVFLECSWEAFEDAGYDPAACPGAVGVFASASSNRYLYDLYADPELVRRFGELRLQIGNEKEFLPTWISYKLDLEGPSVNVQTACSSSLVAVHLACRSLLDGECDLALAGGVSVRSLGRHGYRYQEGGILSPDGRCRAFDAEARGTVNGDGVGVVILKRLEDALADGDNVRAVLKGSAVNNDGASKVGFTAPGLAGQTRVIAEALVVAGVDPAGISYVETHGTGTRLGDPIEVAALTEAFRARTRDRGFCAIGSLKPSIGHLDAAAGVAGLVKVVLALEHRQLPPSLHFVQPNPEIDFAASPFRVNAKLTDWPAGSGPRRAGVSSFGIGGTNAHVVLEEPPPVESGPSRPWQLLVWSARTGAALDAATERLERFLGEADGVALADVAFTLQRGRRAFDHRRALVCRDAADAVAALSEAGRSRRLAAGEAAPRKVAFLFPGQGALRPGATSGLYRGEPRFRAEVDRCAELLRPHLGADLREVMYGEGEEAARRLAETAWAQPVLFVTGWALARLLTSWGVRPGAVLGHSVGELPAACVAGAMALEEALELVALRGRLMQALPAGGMLALPLGEEEVPPLLGSDLSLAAVNGPRRTVVSGPLPALDELERRLAAEGVRGRRLETQRAFHSWVMEPAVPPFADRLRRASSLRAPRVPWLSSATGDWVGGEEACDPGFWERQLTGTVRFGPALARLLRDDDPWVLLELGQGEVLSGFARSSPDLAPRHRAVPSLAGASRGLPEPAALLGALGELWVAGVEVDWAELWRGERRRRVSLPTYPFERQRYLIEKTVPPVDGDDDRTPPDEETSMPPTPPSPQTLSDRRQRILRSLQEMVHDLTGVPVEAVVPDRPFLESGLDSLMLIQASQRIQDRFGVRVSLIQLLDDLGTLDALAGWLEPQVQEDASLDPAPVPAASVPERAPVVAPLAAPLAAPPAAPAWPAPETAAASGSALERIFAQQIQLLGQQLQLLQGARTAVEAPREAAAAPPAPAAAPPPAPAVYTRFGPYEPLEVGPRGTLTARQREHLEAFVRRYTARTARSKEMAERYRKPLADGRSSFGFRRLWKELVYPIYAERALGARLWDVDGNEYTDVSMGFGLHFFGHSPGPVTQALAAQLQEGAAVGPQHPLAGRVAELLCELTGMERAAFCNSGTEAVMGALRIARTWTRRSRVVLFSHSYHGWADATVVHGASEDGRSLPGAPGVAPGALQDVVVLDYDRPESLAWIEANGQELAAVLVEPVRSRTPDHQPGEFLRRLRELTAGSGTVLIFDEMVTGFRIHPGGAQAWFGVRADLATYGKLIAGGLPIGAIAGRAEVMDVLDGGAWRFGDDSYPRAEKTMFTGAFFKHPLTMAAAWAVLSRLKEEGPALQERLNGRTTRLVAELNGLLRAAGAPIDVVSFGSLFRFRVPRELPHADLFFYHLLHHGIFHSPESGNCFLTPAHEERDLERLREAVRRSVADLQDGGFLPGPPSAPPRRREPAPAPEPVAVREAAPAAVTAVPTARRGMELSLYFFGAYEAAFDPAKYGLLLEASRFADQHGFAAVWLPERHFHPVGGLSPNPAVLAAALARETRRIQLRAGSVVVPLHHPVRLAEDWAMVDNLSQGRVGVSFASGWHANDFVFAPDVFDRRQDVTRDGIEAVRSLWRGERLRTRGGAGELEVRLHPLPRQREIPVWLTAASTATYERAGAMGVGVLTNLLAQSPEELRENLVLYREALARHGHDPRGRVTLLLHTFLGPDLDAARGQAQGPLCDYLRTTFGLLRNLVEARRRDIDFDRLSPEETESLVAAACRYYISDRSLIGTPESCATVVERLIDMGVTEVGCFIDFGLPADTVLAGLPYLEQLARRFASPPAQEPPVHLPAPPPRELPLTEAQRELWLAARMGPDASRAYNESVVLRLSGHCDPPALRAAVQEVVDRHAALRATFAADGTRQRIAPLRVGLPLADLAGLPAVARKRAADLWLARQVGDPFDLERGPLLRCGLARLGPGEHLFGLTFHHLVVDGRSGAVLLGELGRLYEAALSGTRCSLPAPGSLEEALARSAVDTGGSETSGAEAYWAAQLDPPPPPLDLPWDRPRPRLPGHSGGRRSRRLPLRLAGEVRRLGAAQGATAFMTLLAAYGALLQRLSGQHDVLVGAPSQEAPEEVVGYFVALLPLRLRVEPVMGFRHLLAATRQTLLAAFEHQPCPISRVLRGLQAARGGAAAPLLAATFNLSRGETVAGFAGVRCEMVRVHPGASRFDLHLGVVEEPDGLLLECDYRGELLDSTTAERWLRHFESLLTAVLADPDRRIAALPLLDESERHQVLSEWSAGPPPQAEDATLPDLFAVQAARTPERIALVAAGLELTYGELDRRADRLARQLRRLGVGPEVPVALFAGRSAEAVTGLLAILKAGGVHVPLDPAYPRQRLDLLLRVTRAEVLLTQEPLAGSVPGPVRSVLQLDAAGESAAERPAPAIAGPANLAYVISTSGSTGRPKVVGIEHRAAVQLLRWARRAFSPDELAGVLASTSFCFDLSVFELFAPLCAGGTVILAGDALALRGLAAAWRVTLLNTVPSAMAELPPEDLPPSLRTVCLAGEALPPALAARLHAHAPNVRLLNLYGPSEDATYSTCAVVAPEASRVTIGRPIAGTRVHVLDREMSPQPIGVRGELYLGGAGLARGYLGLPGATAERFLPDPFAAGERLYRTGDMVRLLAGGELEFLGRTDDQVKVRGFRAEPGEIEAALADHPAVAGAAVVPRDLPGGPGLVAFFHPRHGASVEAGTLRSFLRDRLPAYLIPSLILPVEELPRTASGKLDRADLAQRALPGAPERMPAPPRTPVEELLAGLWAEVLGRPGVGISDDFFEMGGHSLLATQVLIRLRQVFGVDLPMRTLFEAPTVAALAARLEQEARSGGWKRMPPIERVSRRDALPLSFSQRRLWFIDQLEPGNAVYNIPNAVRLEGALDVPALAAALAEIVRRHEILRTTFSVVAGEPVQVIAGELRPELPLADLSSLPAPYRAAELARLVREEAGRPFDLARGPLLRALLVRLAGGEHALLVDLHHIAGDGWSMGVLVRELGTLYEAGQRRLPSPLPELPFQYADFAAWQRRWLSGAVLEAELSWWRERLRGIPPLLDLPTDRPRPAAQSFRGARQLFALPAALSRGLSELARRQGATLFMVLLAAFQALLHRTSGQDDLVVGAPIANRNQSKLEDLIGFFANTLVLRADLSGDPVFLELLRRVRETTLGAYTHQDLPFERLVEELEPRRHLGRNPLFQVAMVLQNVPFGPLEMPGLRWSPVAVEKGTAKFDLLLTLAETPAGLAGSLEYSSDLFEAESAARILGHLLTLLGGAVDDPRLRLSQLPLLSQEERRQLLAGRRQAAPAAIDTLHGAFELQAARSPDSVALVCEGRAVTYGELEARANRLARRLRGLGVGPEVPVGLCLSRSEELIVALLAVLKAGGAYVPLDPGYPPERLAFLLEDALGRLEAPVLVTDAALAERCLPPLREGRLAALRAVLLDAERDELARQSAAPLPPSATAAHLAYVIYTSGSTGRPKGVLVTHDNVLRLFSSTRAWFGFGAADVWTLFHSYAFDFSVWEVWGALLHGGRLVVVPRWVSRAPDAFHRLLVDEGVTVLNQTPSAFGQLVQADGEAGPAAREALALREVIFGGEALDLGALVPWVERRQGGGPRLVNMYGITETTVHVTWRPIGPADLADAHRSPLGSAIPDLWLQVVDRNGDPVPVGVPGEIRVGGAGLARGYLGRPDLTAERFVPDPAGDPPGARLYRSGDLARRRPDGDLDYVGRLDHQVKIRGFRIELGEIEAALLRHPALRDAAVVAREDAPGDRRLVAYVVRRPGAPAPDAGEVDAGGHLGHWRDVFDDAYVRGAVAAEPDFNIAGWTSAYTGRPIPAEEMAEWVERTVERILAHRPAPESVLEIGCGTGLLLFRIARRSRRYVATDFSGTALDWVGRHLAAAGLEERVELLRRAADDFSGVPPGSFDLVILNSVAQYLPDAAYLARVLAGAVEATAPGGLVFVGDVRSLALLEAFHGSVQLAQAPAGMPLAAVRQLAAQRLAQEHELVLDPRFFAALRRRLPRLRRIAVRLKRGRFQNELNGFRYDVLLHVGPADGGPAPAPALRLDWPAEALSLQALRGVLEERRPGSLVLTRVPNGRVWWAVELAAMLRDPLAPATAAEARGVRRKGGGVDPEDLWQLGRETGYDVEIGPSLAEREGRFDALLVRREGLAATPALPVDESVPAEEPEVYASDPRQGEMSRRLAPQLRAFLGELLPEHMIPAAFVPLDALPLTPHGKVDRKALPPPVQVADAGAAPPRGPLDELLAGTFCEVLGLDRVGIHDGFFDLGGHSLLATQLVSRVREALGVELPVRAVFETPTVAGLADRLSGVEPGPAVPPVERADRRRPLPLSFAQQRLWFLDRLEPGSAAYNIPIAVRLSGALDRAALAAAAAEIVRRHESLRTTFGSDDAGEPVQIVAPAAAFVLPHVDLRALPETAREEETRRLTRQEAWRPFDLAGRPPLRATLLELGARAQLLLVALHHIVGDGWSMGVLVRELGSLYEAFSLGRPSPLPELPVQYADYAVWQRRWLSGEPLAAELAWWRRTLADPPEALELPGDRPRPAVQTFRGAGRRMALPPDLARRIHACSRRHGTTLFMTLLASFAALLQRYSRQDGLVIGSPVANRNRPELEGLIGFFVNTLALRLDLAGGPTFRELLHRVREMTLGALAHQNLPFERLVEELQPERSLSRAPVFQVMFVLQNAPLGSLDLPGLVLEPVPVESETAKFDLLLSLSEQGEAIAGAWELNRDLFDPSTIDRMSGHLRSLLEAAAADPGRRLSELPLLGAAERHALLREWNDSRAGEPEAENAAELFEAQAARTPDAVAVSGWEGALSYAELGRRARLLALRLREAGVGRGSRVGICLQRSLAVPEAVLAVLQAGAACLPLDPSYPAERLELMLADAGADALLTDGSWPGLPPRPGVRVLAPGPAGEGPGGRAAEDLRIGGEASGEDLAYVIYTSGSTGRPKGVAMTHRALVNLIAWQRRRSGEPLRTAQFAPLGFDVSFQEMFSTWSAGGTLLLVPEETRRDAAALLELVARERVERLFLPFVALRQLAEAGEARGLRLPHLREVVTAGEALQVAGALAPWFSRLGACRLENQYGPSETHVVTAFALAAAPGEWAALPPVGRPIANCRGYVLGPGWEPAPVGVPGELWIGGVALARGYLARPEATAERFVPDPFGGPGARLYRTGDLARWDHRGDLEFLGRLDHQVKLRGFRVEPEEIEAVLAEHPAVRQAAVTLRAAPAPALVAWVLPRGAAPAAATLREHLRRRLPDYMIPAVFALVDDLPLTPSGKVDRRALAGRKPEAVSEGAAAGPLGPLEELVAGAFAEVLGLDRVGRAESFFELGGQSLLATRLAARLGAVLGTDLPVRAVFEEQTVERLAMRLERGRGGAVRPPLAPVPRAEPLPLSFAQQRLWFVDRLEPGNPAYHLPLALRLRGPLDPAALTAAVSEIVRRHEVLRTTFPSAPSGEPEQKIAAARPVPLPLLDLTRLEDAEREREILRLCAGESRRPFDLEAGPVVRWRLMALGDEDHLLLAVLHHIAGDAWSLGILARELGALYGGRARGTASPLPEPPVQYVDYAAWQRRWLTPEALEADLAFWRARLEGRPAALDLPFDRPHSAARTWRGASRSGALPSACAVQLSTVCRRQGATLFMGALTVLLVLLRRYTGQEDLVVGSPVAGRDRLETEGVVGLFVNLLVLRHRVTGAPSFAALLEQVRDGVLTAFEHRHLPFDRLVEHLRPAAGSTPLFQVGFALQNAPAAPPELPGLRLEVLPLDSGATQFDLGVQVAEAADGLRVSFGYSTELFEPATVERMLRHFIALSGALASGALAPALEVPLLDEAERHQLVREWSGAAPPAAAAESLGERLARRAAEAPDAIALEAGDAQLSYRELAARSNQLARHLRRRGVGPEVPVGLCFERSLEMIVGVLGVLEAGGVHVPLDPAHPAERLDLILRDALAGSPVRLFLTQRELSGRFQSLGGALQVLELDTGWREIAGESRAPFAELPGPRQLAYVIYTSGSTGTPKGVAVAHGGFANLCAAQERRFGLGADDRVLQFAALGFDLSLWEIAMAFCAGARLCLAGRRSLADGSGLLGLLRGLGVTTVTLPPAALAALPEEELPALHTLIVGGEAWSAELARRWSAAGRRLFNGYGPTEVTVCASTALLPGETSRLPLGEPLDGMRLYVLDEGLEPVPPGVAGELCVAGPGVARGYLGRPRQTAAVFVPDPHGEEAGGRLYRTGDLARRLADGGLEFLGRIDRQVKVRGHRIELGEVEAALAGCAGVRAAAVVLREDLAGGRGLAGFVVLEPGANPDPATLRRRLGERLPAAMVPARLVALAGLPVTPNGKVDRRRLSRMPLPEEAAEPGVAPRTPFEELLAAAFSQLLQRPRVGVDEDFFALGGHSLLATRLASLVRSQLGVELPVRAVFETPTVAGLAALVERARSAGAAAAAPLRPAGRETPPPLSFAQQRLWFLHRLDPAGTAYNMPLAFRVSGALDLAALAAALREIVRRHEALRTRFTTHPSGDPVQRIEPEAELALPVVDLRPLSRARREAEQRALARREAGRPFDLEAGPPLRGALLALGEEEHVLLLTLHHIAGDAWSMDVLGRELEALYQAFSRRRPSPLPELPVQYADFAVWQRAWLSGEVLAAELSWWRQRLAGAPPMLELPADRPRPERPSSRGAVLEDRLPPETGRLVSALAARRGATLFMTLLAAFAELLRRYTGQEDLIVGTTIANRGRAELEGLIGFFVNTLALRVAPARGSTFHELVGGARERALEAYAHQDLPFEVLAAELRPQHGDRRAGLVNVVLQVQNAPRRRLDLPGLELTALETPAETAKFDLVLDVTETSGGLACVWRYSTDLFDRSTILRASRHFASLLGNLAAAPDGPAAAVPLLSAAERHQALVEWNDAARVEAPSSCLHELFALQAASRPEAIALVHEEQALSYGELDRRAGRVAASLQAAGVRAGERVGVCVERSLETVIALLGVLKAGAGYVPLDPHYPRQRLELLLADSGVPVVLIRRELLPSLPGGPAGPRALCLEEAFEAEAGEGAALGGPADPRGLAYVIYTSGSTGRPKGVGVAHESVVRLLAATRSRYGLGAGDVWTLFHSYAFDFSVWEIWGALLHGARLVVVPHRVSRSPQAFLELLAEQGVTVLNQTPSAFDHLVRAETGAEERCGPLSALRLVIFGGETLEPRSLAPWWERHGEGRPRLVNMYGITETTVHVTQRDMERPDLEAAPRSPIGRPIPGLGVCLLDRDFEPVPIGVPGEMYVAGSGVSFGYLGRPERTAERFLPDPFGREPGARLYRTGDLARFRADGELEYLGRIDRQVKVRGFRIELGEIEAALARHPRILQAAVLAVEDPRPGAGPARERRLVAAVVTAGGEPPATAELREFLGASLPDYMLPASVVALDALPLDAHGKVDRRVLSETARAALEGRVERAAGYVAPRTELERYLAGLWSEVLGVPRVGVEDDFFELGGSSIGAARVANRLQQELREIVHVVVVFDAPTVSRLAAYLTESHREAVARAWGPPAAEQDARPAARPARRIDEEKVAQMRRLLQRRVN